MWSKDGSAIVFVCVVVHEKTREGEWERGRDTGRERERGRERGREKGREREKERGRERGRERERERNKDEKIILYIKKKKRWKNMSDGD